MNFRLRACATVFSLFTPIGLALAQNNLPTGPSTALSNNNPWPRANCTQLLSIGSPSPAWISSGNTPPKAEALLTLINYQMALSLCQQEQLLQQLQEQHKTLKSIDGTSMRQERLNHQSKEIFQRQQELLETLNNHIQKPNLPEPSLGSNSTSTVVQNPQVSTVPQTNSSANLASPPLIDSSKADSPLLQDSQMPQLERTLLRLIELLSQQVKNNTSSTQPIPPSSGTTSPNQ